MERQPPREKGITQPEYAVLTTQEYLEDFRLEAKTVKGPGRMSAQVMALEAGSKEADHIVGTFTQAPKELVKTLYYDGFSEYQGSGVIYANYALMPQRSETARQARVQQKKLQEIQETLRTADTTIHVTNRPTGFPAKPIKHMFPFIGTSHIKGSYVETEGKSAFYLHTNNFEPQERYNDVTIKFTGEKAKRLIKAFDRINTNPPEEDEVIEIGDDTILFVDAGKKGKSIILDKAVTLVQNAQERVQNSSVLFPDGPFASALQDAHAAGLAVDVLTSRFTFDCWPFYTANNAFTAVHTAAKLAGKLSGHSFMISEDLERYMHAKILIVDGIWAMVGSHNLSAAGVKAGTREAQILTSNPAIIQGLQRHFARFKAQTERIR